MKILPEVSFYVKQQRCGSPSHFSDINTPGVGRIRDSYANPKRSRGFALLSRMLPTPRVFISGYANTGRKFSIAFIKYFLKLVRQMKGILFINFLIQKDFLNIRSRQSSFLLTNQKAHLITHEPMKFSVTKVKSKFKSRGISIWEKVVCCKFRLCWGARCLKGHQNGTELILMIDEPLAADEVCYSSDFHLYEARFKQKFWVLRCYSADIFHRRV